MGRTNVIIGKRGGQGIAPGDVTGLVAVAKDTKVAVKFTDPANTVIDGQTVCTWAGTKLVYKIGSFPANPDDGVQVLDNTVRNAYSSTPFQVTGLTNGTKYYFRLFPYSTENVINLDGENAFVSTPVEIAPGDVTSIAARADNGQVTISWNDPNDIVDGGSGIKICAWAGTKLRYKTGGYPSNETDGILAVNSTTKNQYSSTGYTITGLENGTVYYFQLFPYSDVGTYNNNSVNRISATPVSTRIYGVQRQISSSSTAWTRLNDAVGLTANATKDGGAVTNDFDSRYPWSDIISVDISADGTINRRYGDADFSFTNPIGHIMTYVPEFWWKRVQENGYEKVYIADAEVSGYTKSDAFYIGRYDTGGNSSAVNSKSGVAPVVNVSITDLRTYSKNVGTNWGLMDIWRWSMLQILYLVEYADYNSQDKLGYGNSNSGAKINNGGCDSLGMKSGTLNDDKAHAVIYRGVENVFGNVRQWLDGINIKSYKSWVCRNRNQYASDQVSSPYVQLGYTEPSSGGYISKMGYDSNYPEVQRAIECSGSDSTYCPDFFYSISGTRAVYVGGYYGNDLYCGLWYASSYTSSYTYTYLGGRLLFIPE